MPTGIQGDPRSLRKIRTAQAIQSRSRASSAPLERRAAAIRAEIFTRELSTVPKTWTSSQAEQSRATSPTANISTKALAESSSSSSHVSNDPPDLETDNDDAPASDEPDSSPPLPAQSDYGFHYDPMPVELLDEQTATPLTKALLAIFQTVSGDQHVSHDNYAIDTFMTDENDSWSSLNTRFGHDFDTLKVQLGLCDHNIA